MANMPGNSYELVVLLGLMYQTLIDELHVRLNESGYGDVRPAHGFVFQLLSYRGATGNEIAEHLGMTKQAASQMIDYLEEHGYVRREPHPSDRRGKMVVLTERGWGCIREVEAIFIAQEQRLTEMIGEARMQLLREDLRKMLLAAHSGTFPRFFRPVW